MAAAHGDAGARADRRYRPASEHRRPGPGCGALNRLLRLESVDLFGYSLGAGVALQVSVGWNPDQHRAWLFPGRRPGQPMQPRCLAPALRAHGIPVESGLTAAIRQLVRQAPASVVAGMLGYHDKTGAPGIATPLATTTAVPTSERSPQLPPNTNPGVTLSSWELNRREYTTVDYPTSPVSTPASARLGRCLVAMSISADRVRVGLERPESPWSRESPGGASEVALPRPKGQEMRWER
jgi:hypothetical protein